jgi:uncharacterized protein
MGKPLVLYHGGNCADGFCAAWVAHRHFGDAADYLPVQYGEPSPDVTGRDLFVLDFSYKRPLMLEMVSEADSTVVLDHHKTAAEDLAGLTGRKMFLHNGRLYDTSPGKPFRVVFDTQKSGGRLTQEYFFPEQPSPWLVDYTEDRDLWRWKLDGSREVSAALASYPHSFDQWNEFHEDDESRDDLIIDGAAILRYQKTVVDSHVRNAMESELDGHFILVANATTLISEVAHALAVGRPFGAAYFMRPDGKTVWSLRSTEDGIDVSEIAKKHGGGGHKHAAGFEV